LAHEFVARHDQTLTPFARILEPLRLMRGMQNAGQEQDPYKVRIGVCGAVEQQFGVCLAESLTAIPGISIQVDSIVIPEFLRKGWRFVDSDCT
jgi:hypothetical protein